MAVEEYDVVVVGAGMGGIYALHRYREQGLKVLGLEGAPGVGGVWFHNRYPGARVDLESIDYCYYFSSEIFNEWRWTERYASQPELLRYLNVRHPGPARSAQRLIQFETWLTAAEWHPERAQWDLGTSTGGEIRTRFLVMATGNLSAARTPAFPGLNHYKGEWVRTSHWPDRDVKIAGRKVAVIGTGSSGVQSIPVIAEAAEHLTVFQRSPNYSVPACNRAADEERLNEIRARVPEVRKELFATVGASNVMLPSAPMADYDDAEIEAKLEKQWNSGGHGMSYLFADQGRNQETNDKVAEFVRSKIRSIVKNPEWAEKLSPRDHGLGTRRLCVDTDYYATFNRDNVTLVDVRDNPIARITETGIELEDGERYDVDLIVFALGFHPFTGALGPDRYPQREGRAADRPLEGGAEDPARADDPRLSEPLLPDWPRQPLGARQSLPDERISCRLGRRADHPYGRARAARGRARGGGAGGLVGACRRGRGADDSPADEELHGSSQRGRQRGFHPLYRRLQALCRASRCDSGPGL